MNRKYINKIALCGFVAASVGFTSCEDFLTITPTNAIVEEDFWEDRNDLENVVTACYKRIIASDILEKYILFGEGRSENYTKSQGTSWQDLDNLMNANLLPTSDMFNWTAFYNHINFCNKVLAHGPETVANDESFSTGDWMPMRAEAVTLRALSHFWLVRTYGEVPYVTQEYNNDSQYMLIRQSTQQQVLDSIIMDLEEVKEYAMRDYGNIIENKGRITDKAVYALLADVYLWRASKNASADSVAIYGNQSQEDYLKCIECCDYIINKMLEEKEKNIRKNGLVIGDAEIKLTVEDLLIPNEQPQGTSGLYVTNIGAYNNIFGSGNSEESIFELQFDGTNNSNSITGSFFINETSGAVGRMVCTEALFNSATEGGNELVPSSVFPRTDWRRWESTVFSKFGQIEFPMGKYRFKSISQANGTGQLINNNIDGIQTTPSIRNRPNDANWIHYRISDIMLMKAEALSQLYSDEEHLKEAFQLARNIYKRSNPYAYSLNNKEADKDSLKFESFNTQDGIESLVMAERHREFIGEGKRWFDLVRYAQRRGETETMIKNYLGRKYSQNKNAVAAKLSTIESLFSPVYKKEMDNNKLLHQNRIWNISESTSKTDNL